MSSERESGQNLPPVVNPREFLNRPFERVEIGRLSSPPDKSLLTFLPTLKDETGLVLVKPHWFVIKASDRGVPTFLMPKTSDVLLHSHPKDEEEDIKPGYVPSAGDFLNCSETATNIIVSHSGVTRYWNTLFDWETKRKLESAIFKKEFQTNIGAYEEFLKEIGARFEVYPWEEIDGERLSELLNF